MNAVTAIFLATGQDVASAAESVTALMDIKRATPEEIALYQQDCLHRDDLEGGRMRVSCFRGPEKPQISNLLCSGAFRTVVILEKKKFS